MSQEETAKSAQQNSTTQAEQLSESAAAEFSEELDDSQLEPVVGGAEDSKQKQIDDISKWGG